eukprot:11994652-Alexandrium_andersonii.AAC.1
MLVAANKREAAPQIARTTSARSRPKAPRASDQALAILPSPGLPAQRAFGRRQILRSKQLHP